MLATDIGGVDKVFDFTKSVDHRSDTRSDEVGIIYSCAGGFLDLGHVRDLVDLTLYYYRQLKKIGKAALPASFPPGAYSGRVVVKAGVDLTSEDVMINTARAMAFDEAVFHEIESYWVDSPGMHTSSFSPEDLPSNLYGTHIAGRAIRAGRKFDEAVTNALGAFIVGVGGLDRPGTFDAFAKVKGKWVDGLPLASGTYLKRRNVNWKTPTPWLVPNVSGCPKGALPPNIQLPAGIRGNYEAEYEVDNVWIYWGDKRQAHLGTSFQSSNFDMGVTGIAADASDSARYGLDWNMSGF